MHIALGDNILIMHVAFGDIYTLTCTLINSKKFHLLVVALLGDVYSPTFSSTLYIPPPPPPHIHTQLPPNICTRFISPAAQSLIDLSMSLNMKADYAV